MINTLIRHRDLILYKSLADLRAEARRYYISYAWWLLEPLLEMAVFYIIFNVLFSRGGPNFIQFLLVGLVAWKWFGTTVQHCGNSLIGSRGLIMQTSLPKVIFPTVLILTDTFKAAIVSVIVSILLFLTGFPPNQTYLALPLLLTTQLLFIMAVGFGLAAIVPFFPDLSILVSLLLRMLYFLSGVFFDPRNISGHKRELFFLNPMARLIDGYRGIFLHHRWPEAMPLLLISIISVLIIYLAAVFIKSKDTIYPRIVSQ